MEQIDGDGAPPPDEPLEESIREAAHMFVVPGFLTRAEATEAVREFLELDEDDHRPASAVEAVWRVRLAEQQGWSGPGDYQRLAAAFARLGELGVLGRMNFTCCQTCGTAEIDDERTPADDGGGYPWREWAYTFFHEQDAERLIESPAILFLSYSAFRPAPDLDPALVQAARAGDEDARRSVVRETDASVGRTVANAVRETGLHVDWDGDPGQRIAVHISDWRKPLPT